MNARLIAALLVTGSSLIAGNSFAQDAAPLTRQQVATELAQARAAGAIAPTGEVGFSSPAVSPKSATQLTRSVVHSEYLQAARNGALAPRGEGADVGYVASGHSDVARATIKAEARYAARNHQLGGGEV
jgi:hypothetical protein